MGETWGREREVMAERRSGGGGGGGGIEINGGRFSIIFLASSLLHFFSFLFFNSLLALGPPEAS